MLSEYMISRIADSTGLVSAVSRQMSGADHPPLHAAKPAPQFPVRQNAVMQQPQIPAQPQPRVLTEEEADALHAAQHLLNQGMISPKQYSGMLMPPEPEILPEQPADINAQNAEDYLHRQELIAEQLGIEPQVTEEKPEKDEYGRTGLV